MDEVDEVADQVLGRARMLKETLRDSLQHYIGESAQVLANGAFGALHEALHHNHKQRARGEVPIPPGGDDPG